VFFFVFFFFQAEDGIRDGHVTGVQTCALPISITFGSYGQGLAQIANADGAVWIPAGRHDLVFNGLDLTSSNAIVFSSAATGEGRSEERRVGKECRSRWAP